jgi:hypothetical protein
MHSHARALQDDALVSSPFANSNAGAVYIWWGSATKQTEKVDYPMSIASGSTKSFLITGSTGAARARLGWSVAPVGDINGDGKTPNPAHFGPLLDHPFLRMHGLPVYDQLDAHR